MRQKRAKAYRKLMAMYELHFGFRQPYQVLVDSTMCLAAQDQKIDLVKQLQTVLQGKIKPMITQCSIVELYKLGKGRQPAVDLAKEFERRKCNHREAIDGQECLESVVGEKNKHRYVIASQHYKLRLALRKVPAVPIVHINRAVMILEPPSEETIRVKAEMVEAGLEVSQEEKTALSANPEASTTIIQQTVHKKAKGPNPLSVKKKKAKDPLELSVSISKKRKRYDDQDVEMHDLDREVTGTKEGEGEIVGEVGERKKKRRRRAKGVTEDHTPVDGMV